MFEDFTSTDRTIRLGRNSDTIYWWFSSFLASPNMLKYSPPSIPTHPRSSRVLEHSAGKCIREMGMKDAIRQGRYSLQRWPHEILCCPLEGILFFLEDHWIHRLSPFYSWKIIKTKLMKTVEIKLARNIDACVLLLSKTRLPVTLASFTFFLDWKIVVAISVQRVFLCLIQETNI